MNKGDLAVEAGDFVAASELYEKAEGMFPDNLEMQYWHAINLANTNKMSEALPMFKSIFKKDEHWRTLTPRLINNGVLNVSDDQLQAILAQ